MRRAIVTGNFDGLHLGHQYLFAELKELSRLRKLKPCVISFEPHTSIVTRKPKDPFLITTSIEKRHILESRHGMESQLIAFSEDFMKMSAIQYLEDILVGKFGAKLWLLGFDHRFGFGAEERSTELDNKAKQLGVELIQSKAVFDGSEPVSSTRVRSYLMQGEIPKANALLGSQYIIHGEVHRGDQIGRKMGFPTANLLVNPWKQLPAHGVYAAEVEIGAKRYLAAVHIGPRPTLGTHEIRVEAHILDFEKDIYCQNLQLELTFRIRSIMSFDSPEELVSQINDDIRLIRKNAELKTKSVNN